ncbi:hypothetical protein [Streptomyces sp. H39-C1]|uniref:hypothetical protein n=1 Tax=Streptomyces sp. H39-C1 TaxID=3004355 RepID=UPI0022AED230|nr:hypothetical protein [Streptomyces sp. H39-C1]MCZ4101796.1 hypothetical protein [Streptomyces sp. H39-C1]
MPGSRSSLETLSEVVASACFAASQLARAVADNPFEASTFAGGPPVDDAAMRRALHAEAAPLLALSLTTAAYHLNLCATCCHYTASGITRDLERTASTSAGRPVPRRLSDAQYQALRSLAQGGATMQTRGRGSAMVCTPDFTVITIATFQSLDKRGLLHLDTSVPLYKGRSVTVTAEGHHALDRHSTSKCAATAPSAAATAAKGPRR